MLNVHLVCHTHDDVGWKKTVDEYFYGRNNSIQHAGVQYILDSVFPALKANPNRRFIYVEIAFFFRWWREQTPSMQEEVRGFVENGQLEFINGGWCMNDEATTHYNAIIDQMTVGHTWLLDTFGVTPTVGWHIDPFGHSATMATLMAQMNFDSFYFGRIDWQDKAMRLTDLQMEFMWNGSRSQGEAVEIFSGVTYNLYQPPPGYNFDMLGSNQIPMQEDPNLEGVNTEERVNGFVEACLSQAEHYTTNNIMLTMGSDFEYENANEWYTNLDMLIDAVNADGRINAFYSTPSAYTKSVLSNGTKWTYKSNDFFSYADGTFSYWSGFYTSRPALKAYVRESNNILQTCKQMEFVATATQQLSMLNGTSSLLARHAMGVLQHHDAVSGTEQQHVADDYALRLAAGNTECNALTNNVLASLLTTKGTPPDLQTCPLLNVSVCNASASEDGFTVVVYNPLAQGRADRVRVPVFSKTLSVLNEDGESVVAQIEPVTSETATVRGDRGDAPYTLTFTTQLPPMGASVYFVSESSEARVPPATLADVRDVLPGDDDVVISNEFVTLTFNPSTGLLTKMKTNEGSTLDVSQTFEFYNASTGNNLLDNQCSGAYIFRPNSSRTFPVADGGPLNTSSWDTSSTPSASWNPDGPWATLTVVNGSVCSEVQQVFSSWVSNVFRVCTGQPFAESEYMVGPIPIGDNLGKEVISKYSTNIDNSGYHGNTWYTDGNGREMQTRVFDYRETYELDLLQPVADNYFPVNTAVRIQDNTTAFTILTDRSQGGSSMSLGELELMVHRRLLRDDDRGVDQALNETGRTGLGLVTRGRHRLLLSTPQNISNLHRIQDLYLTYGQTVSFGPASDPTTWAKDHVGSVAIATTALPPNVHLLTLETLNTTAYKYLVRLAHVFAVDESEEYSTPAYVDLTKLFTPFSIKTVEELAITANQPKPQSSSSSTSTVDPTNIMLTNMEIRTFSVTVKAT